MIQHNSRLLTNSCLYLQSAIAEGHALAVIQLKNIFEAHVGHNLCRCRRPHHWQVLWQQLQSGPVCMVRQALQS